MEEIIYCANHQKKIAKRHCNKCNVDICNECVIQSHVEHHNDIQKITYSINPKTTAFNDFINKEIQTLVKKELKNMEEHLLKLVTEKTADYIKNQKSISLKVSGAPAKISGAPPKVSPPPVKNEYKPPKKEKKEENKDIAEIFEEAMHDEELVPPRRRRVTVAIGNMAKLFDGSKKSTAAPKFVDQNNPFNKGAKEGCGVRNMAQIFDKNKK